MLAGKIECADRAGDAKHRGWRACNQSSAACKQENRLYAYTAAAAWAAAAEADMPNLIDFDDSHLAAVTT